MEPRQLLRSWLNLDDSVDPLILDKFRLLAIPCRTWRSEFVRNAASMKLLVCHKCLAGVKSKEALLFFVRCTLCPSGVVFYKESQGLLLSNVCLPIEMSGCQTILHYIPIGV